MDLNILVVLFFPPTFLVKVLLVDFQTRKRQQQASSPDLQNRIERFGRKKKLNIFDKQLELVIMDRAVREHTGISGTKTSKVPPPQRSTHPGPSRFCSLCIQTT
jgi:hypothetical protein